MALEGLLPELICAYKYQNTDLIRKIHLSFNCIFDQKLKVDFLLGSAAFVYIDEEILQCQSYKELILPLLMYRSRYLCVNYRSEKQNNYCDIKSNIATNYGISFLPCKSPQALIEWLTLVSSIKVQPLLPQESEDKLQYTMKEVLRTLPGIGPTTAESLIEKGISLSEISKYYIT
eukprot:NODE_9090_length_621_cov_21.566265_g8462_i0.p1 GENE.NODE_9090_length_621_cov_21.566265_g8462_i0~~NODE_9090_length_621_cov_21.566265_g8462_i0.p1  ORF type:complete len:193 (-),score=30.17 NODE_9090_length_621_cov_21.566265_g8462_i0:41-565(-)